MHRVLAGLIAVVLAAGIGSAIVKSNNSKPVVLGPTPSPSQTYTFPGLPPTVAPTDTPIVPDTSSPTPTPTSLANTGDGSFAFPAVVMLALALAGGLAVYRGARRA